MAVALGGIPRHRVADRSLGGGLRWRDFDPFLLITTIVLMVFGVVAIWSAEGGGPLVYANLGVKQGIFAFLGIFMMFIVSAIDYRFFNTLAWILYGVAIFSLVAVLVPGVGTEIAGSQRWFLLPGGVSIQPSEFGKVATILAMASFVSSRGAEMRDFGNFLVSGLIAVVPMVLVFLQPDLGTTIVYGIIWLSILLVSQTSRKFFGLLLLLAGPAFVFAWEFVFHDYQKTRLLVSYDPERDPLRDGFNIIQARISIGSGDLFGAGLQGGSQSQAELLKVRESDFIFAHASGMFGFIGMLALFLSFGILLWRCLAVVETSKDSFGQFVAVGVSATLFFQAFVNIGMNLGLMPVTGITLPFVSSGASSLWSFLIAQGILQSIRMRHRKLAFQVG